MSKTHTVKDEVRRILSTKRGGKMPYAKVAEEVRGRVPGSQTTARAVASIVTSLRHGGVELPDRRLGH